MLIAMLLKFRQYKLSSKTYNLTFDFLGFEAVN